jgi:hypothetical protein
MWVQSVEEALLILVHHLMSGDEGGVFFLYEHSGGVYHGVGIWGEGTKRFRGVFHGVWAMFSIFRCTIPLCLYQTNYAF